MTTPHITQLRQHLLETLADLRNPQKPMEPDRARAVAAVAGVIVDSARAEIDFLRVTNQDRSQFFGEPEGLTRIAATPSAHNPFPVSARHVLGD